MNDPTRNYHGGDTNSNAAATLTERRRQDRMDLVLHALKHAGERGMTSEQLEDATGIAHQSMGGILIKLIEEGRIHRPGERRPQRSGAKAWVCYYGPGLCVGRISNPKSKTVHERLLAEVARSIREGDLRGPAVSTLRLDLEAAGFRVR